MTRHTLPKIGSRARRVLDALFSFPTSPVEERALMARHALDDQSPAKWRKEVYQSLQDGFLMVRQDAGFNGAACWALTDKGRCLMRAEQAAAMAPKEEPRHRDVRMAQPRTVPAFRPMALGALVIRTTRDGALDYQSIPSLMGGQRCV